MTWSKTERADYLFKVSEYGDGTPFISMEPRGSGLRICEEGQILFDLKPDTTIEQAEEFAKLLNKNIEHVGFTAFSDRPPD